MAHTYTSCLIHYIFGTKGRRKSIASELRQQLWPYVGGIARANGCKALAVGGTDDHIHLLLSLHRTITVAKAVQLIKGGSSKWIHDSFPAHREFVWQEGYGAFSIGVSGIEETTTYVNRQEEHHRTRTFEEEYIVFLDRHGIEYDERYVFD